MIWLIQLIRSEWAEMKIYVKEPMLLKNLSTLVLAGLLMVQQPINAENNNPFSAIVLGTVTATSIIAATIGYYFGYASNDKVAKNQNRQHIVDVENINIDKEYSQLSYLTSHNRSDILSLLVHIYNNGTLIDGDALNAYCTKSFKAIENLKNQLSLWKRDPNFNQELLNEAKALLNSEEMKEKIEKISKLQKFAGQLKRIEPYLAANKYFERVKDCAYNYDHKEFSLIYTITKMQEVHDNLVDHRKNVTTILSDTTGNNEHYQQLINNLGNAINILENSIVNIRNSDQYQTQLKDKNFSDKKDKLIATQLLNEKNREKDLDLKLQEQRKYKQNWENTKKQLEIVKKDKEDCLKELNNEKEKNKKLREEIKKLEARAQELEREISRPKPALSAQDESHRIEELKQKEKELANLRYEIEIMKSKIKTNNLPANSDDTLVVLINWVHDL